MRSSGVSPMPTRMPLVNGIFSSPAARIISSRRSGCLVGEPWWATRSGLIDSSISPCEAVTSRRRSSSSRVQTPMFVCGSMPRSIARSQVQTTYEVKSSWPYSRQPAGDLGVDLGLLAGEDEQLLGPAPRRVVEQLLDLVGRIQMGPVRRERAVLAVALARPRQRDREVAREGDPPHPAQSMHGRSAASPAQPTGSSVSGPLAPRVIEQVHVADRRDQAREHRREHVDQQERAEAAPLAGDEHRAEGARRVQCWRRSSARTRTRRGRARRRSPAAPARGPRAGRRRRRRSSARGRRCR